MGKFIINKTKTGYTFALKASNNETIAISEVYTTEAACRKGIESVIKNAPVANTEDQTVNGFAEEKNPKFEIYLDKAGEYRFRLKASNGQIITSSEGYKQKTACRSGIDSVKKNVDKAEIVEAGQISAEENDTDSMQKDKLSEIKPVERKKTAIPTGIEKNNEVL